MKKLLILFGLVFTLSSFNNNEYFLVKETNASINTSFVKTNNRAFINIVGINKLVTKNLTYVVCTATVTYNGMIVAVFTSTGNTASEACADAYIRAVSYIASHN